MNVIFTEPSGRLTNWLGLQWWESLEYCKTRGKLSWVIFSPIHRHVLASSVCDLTSLWLGGKFLRLCKQTPSFHHRKAKMAIRRHLKPTADISCFSVPICLCFSHCIWKSVCYCLSCYYKTPWNLYRIRTWNLGNMDSVFLGHSHSHLTPELTILSP